MTINELLYYICLVVGDAIFGGFFIGTAINNFKREHYTTFGMHVMFAIAEVIHMTLICISVWAK